MRKLVDTPVAEMEAPDSAAREVARSAEATPDAHAQFMTTWPSLNTLEVAPAPLDLPLPRTFTVAAWNIERCKRVEDSAELIRRSGADIVLATEMDNGMARSGQRHTTRDLASILGFGYVYGVEFVELGTGDPYETELFRDAENTKALHGNAIVSRYPLTEPKLIPLDDGGRWYVTAPKADGQRRVGGRMAIAAQVATQAGPVTVVSVHFESASDARDRDAQAKRLLASLHDAYGPGPMVLGGDLNTAALAGKTQFATLNAPNAFEPCFDTFEAHGLSWQTANTGAPTTRAAPGRAVLYPLVKLDWLLMRDLHASKPQTLAAVSDTGDYLSDHEMVLAQVAPIT